jgi:DNA-binding transcriptional ArsR family regulator
MNHPPEPLECDPAAAADFLRAVGHPTRLRILCRLIDGEAAVSTFETEMGLKQPNLSQQLGLLREAGLVTTRREAKSVFYSLADAKVEILLAALRTAFAPANRGAKAETRPAAGQRLAMLAQAAAHRTWPPRQPGPKPTGECGVFSVAGWDAIATIRSGEDPAHE